MTKFVSKDNFKKIWDEEISPLIRNKQDKLPEGTEGQVLTKTNDGAEWQDAKGEEWDDIIIEYPYNSNTSEVLNIDKVRFKSNLKNPRVVVKNSLYNKIYGIFTPYKTTYDGTMDSDTLTYYFEGFMNNNMHIIEVTYINDTFDGLSIYKK